MFLSQAIPTQPHLYTSNMNFLKRHSKPSMGNRLERNVAKGIHRRRLESTLLQRNFKPLRLLIVDDKRSNRDVLSSILSSLNIKSDQAESGRKAIQQCTHRKFDIILMDCMMPDIDGFETASRIRSTIQAQLKVILRLHGQTGK